MLLTKDEKRKKVIGFVPNHQLRYVVPDDLELTVGGEATPVETEREAAGSADDHEERVENATGDDLVVGPPASATEPAAELGGDGTVAVSEGRDGDADAVELRPEPAADASAEESELCRLGGLGSTYAERLQAAGYETLADLAVSDPVAVAEAASVAPGRGRRWVNAAERAVASEVPEEGEAEAAREREGEPGGEEIEPSEGDDASGAETGEGDGDEDAEGDGEEKDAADGREEEHAEDEETEA
ncbi:hypothetical protein [Salinigranum marinum]|uniref:hypothetical protein n=1 Tax=Salinigranum marinum TaxID=1515595 RepID=UPI002989C788|nr:hypothetical protein [Salinigranum marinum]